MFCACRHVAALDHPEAGCRFLPLARGPVTIQGVRDSAGIRTSTGGPEPPAVGLSAYFFRNTWCSRTFPNQGTGPGPLSGEQGFRTAGVRLLDVGKDNYKAPFALSQQEGVPQSWGTDRKA